MKVSVLLGLLLLLHSAYSAAQHRVYSRETGKLFESIPTDVYIETILAVVISAWGLVGISGTMKPIKLLDTVAKTTFDSVDVRPSFMSFNTRGKVATSAGPHPVVLPPDEILPDPAFHAIIHHADLSTKLALSQTSSHHRTLFTSSSLSLSITSTINMHKAKHIMRRVSGNDRMVCMVLAGCLTFSVIWCIVGLYVAFFMFPPRTFLVGILFYMVGMLLVVLSILLLKHLNTHTLRFIRRTKALGGFLEAIEVVREDMPCWWRLCMRPHEENV